MIDRNIFDEYLKLVDNEILDSKKYELVDIMITDKKKFEDIGNSALGI